MRRAALSSLLAAPRLRLAARRDGRRRHDALGRRRQGRRLDRPNPRPATSSTRSREAEADGVDRRAPARQRGDPRPGRDRRSPRRIHDATVPVIVWVGPSPAKAQGAGLLLLYAASLGAVAPGVGVGPLEPLDLGRTPTRRPRPTCEALVDVVGRGARPAGPRDRSPTSRCRRRRRSTAASRRYAAASVPDLLDAARRPDRRHGRRRGDAPDADRRAPRASRPSRCGSSISGRSTACSTPRRRRPGSTCCSCSGSPALAFELTQPGFGFAGFAGVAMLALAVYGLTVVPFSWPGLVAADRSDWG